MVFGSLILIHEILAWWTFRNTSIINEFRIFLMSSNKNSFNHIGNQFYFIFSHCPIRSIKWSMLALYRTTIDEKKTIKFRFLLFASFLFCSVRSFLWFQIYELISANCQRAKWHWNYWTSSVKFIRWHTQSLWCAHLGNQSTRRWSMAATVSHTQFANSAQHRRPTCDNSSPMQWQTIVGNTQKQWLRTQYSISDHFYTALGAFCLCQNEVVSHTEIPSVAHPPILCSVQMSERKNKRCEERMACPQCAYNWPWMKYPNLMK